MFRAITADDVNATGIMSSWADINFQISEEEEELVRLFEGRRR